MKRIAVVLAVTVALGSCSEDSCACSYAGGGPDCGRLHQIYERHRSADGRDEHDVRIARHVLARATDGGCNWATT